MSFIKFMPNDFLPPTKKELREKYCISNDDFEVLTGTEEPPANTEPKTDWFQRVPDWLTFTTFLRWRGVRVIAVVIIVQTAFHGFRDTVVSDWAGIKKAFAPFKALAPQPDLSVYFSPVATTANSVVTVVSNGSYVPPGLLGLSPGSGTAVTAHITT